MPGLDLTALNAAIDAQAAEAARTESTEDSAGVVISGFSAQITAAVTEALAGNQPAIDTATAAIAQVTARYVAADDKLGAAIASFTPATPQPRHGR